MIYVLRAGSHKLKVETERQSRIPREQRKCACGEVEDEKHFLTKCGNYELERLRHDIKPDEKICDTLSRRGIETYLKELYRKRTK